MAKIIFVSVNYRDESRADGAGVELEAGDWQAWRNVSRRFKNRIYAEIQYVSF